MVKYTTEDIIKRASQLADMENSDFISDYEKLALLNESWNTLYQKIINSNDKTFIKTVPVRNGMKLPKDFYQLADIYTKTTRAPIAKRTQYEGYDIVNGKIELSPEYNNVSVVMEYYPAPKTLYLRGKTINSPYDSPISCNRTLYVDEERRLHDVNDDDVLIDTNEYVGTDGTVFIFDNALYSNNDDEGDTNGLSFNYFDFNQRIKLPKMAYKFYVPFIIDNVMYIYDQYRKIVTDVQNNRYQELDLSEFVDKDTRIIYTNRSFDTMFIVKADDTIQYLNRLEKVADIDCDYLTKCFLNGKSLYGVTGRQKLVKITDKVTIIPTDNIPVCMVNPESVLTYRPLSRRYFIEGCVESTVLDFSNNIYYIMISYLLAMAFKAKQNADSTALAAQYQLAEAQFFDSINKDINTQYRIKDEYSVRGFGIWM